MGAKPSNFNQMNAMATDRKSRVNDQGTREQARQAVAGTEKQDENSIPESHENPEAERLRAMKAENAEE